MSKKILVTGGAGFVGSNLTHKLLLDGNHVTVVDSLARKGSEKNLQWLSDQHQGHRFRFVHGDIRDFNLLRVAAQDVDVIYHLAAQVAVTTSVDDPRNDFEVNALGTLNLLEAARLSGRRPTIVFTSTNKVYGGLEDLSVAENGTRYYFKDLPNGVPESRSLDFHSPYGCSKGAADQYVRDYGRIYGIPTVVFRMSCIYGPRQFGNEDQGWVAHFMIAAKRGVPITIYGNGKQVRDVLFVDDLVRAFRIAVEKIDVTAGQIYNIGGGPTNTMSVWAEFGCYLGDLSGRKLSVTYSDWRPGDQPCYVSDTTKAGVEMDWKPEVDMMSGIHQLWDWVSANPRLFDAPTEVTIAPKQGHSPAQGAFV
jgi:CDP-paratose 2-epimerase